ncbi:MAG TPA: Uma2 family endonuclease [Terracidiphilus sp.]|nr:Uma2 family endonuclease [Terracidiphilus sp.]
MMAHKESEMAAAPDFVPVEEYLRNSYSPDAEYIDGRIVERESTMGENDHSAWQKAIVVWFEMQAARAGIRVRPELRVQVDTYGFLIPDVTLLDRNRPVEPIATHPPVAVLEVLSPGDSVARVMIKGERYEKMGIRTILILDPGGPAYRFREGKLEGLAERAFTLEGSQARFDLDEIAKLVD